MAKRKRHFDLAISRHGRFDIIIPIMPPKAEEKLKKWSDVAARLETLLISNTGDTKKQIGALTYDEFRVLCPRLVAAANAAEAIQLLAHAYSVCTLNTPADPQAEGAGQTWGDVLKDQERKIRLP
jgi:hypothetical protein